MHKGLGPKEGAINSFWEIEHQASEGRQLRRGGVFPCDKLGSLLHCVLKRKVVHFKTIVTPGAILVHSPCHLLLTHSDSSRQSEDYKKKKVRDV